MASSIVSILTTLFIATIFLFISSPNIVTSTKITTSPLIGEACSNKGRNIDSKLCIKVLQSQRQVVSAKKLFDLSIRIMKSGLSNATNTLKYLEKRLNKPKIDPNLKGALQKCKSSYDLVTSSFKSALSEVRDYKNYDLPSYELLIASTDNIKPCVEIVASKKIKDGIILIGNKVVPIFGLSACNVVDRLYLNSRTPPPPRHHVS
ncbi:hypothetical protein BUALT_Bualt08G0101600 [Buddleja alternifolia]|uniref:Pectinesterase inhibitor domain-containing protein n=1 Tax=Buddleja alternifolia TaxID=168488 RepID=A0AAV6XBQ8_9LAMI|nr:hypothetical protein BUALT_Bualt08G0101600 [Buddleja alternifolia]